MKQTQMNVCTLEELILVDLDTLLHKVEVVYIGNYTGIYTIVGIDKRRCEKGIWHLRQSLDRGLLIELQLHEKCHIEIKTSEVSFQCLLCA